MNILISNSSDEPIYSQITKQIKANILKGGLPAFSPLPSIRTLAKELEISVITTKRAYDDLEREGFIETVPGKGSFVASRNKELLREAGLKIVEEKLSDTVAEAKSIGMEYGELLSMLDIIFMEK